MATDCAKTCGNCCHSVLHIPIKDRDNQHMLCLNWSMVTMSKETCNHYRAQTDVNYFHTWDERNLKVNTIEYETTKPFE